MTEEVWVAFGAGVCLGSVAALLLAGVLAALSVSEDEEAQAELVDDLIWEPRARIVE